MILVHPLAQWANRVVFRRLPLVLAAVCAVGAWAPGAAARVETESPYTRLQTFNGALRYLRVDLGLEVVERDFDAGYLLFKYVAMPGQTPSRGAIEVIEVNDEVKVVVQLPEEPSHHENLLSDGLMKKLEAEYGEPPPKNATDDPPEDGGEDDGKNDAEDDARDGDGDGDGAAPPTKKTRRKLRRRQRR
jgi:hypothetical protein